MRTVNTLAELNDLAGSGELRGLFRLSNELYHEGPGLSSTGLKELLKSPAHYQAYLSFGTEETAAMSFGTRAHMRLLEPELFATTVLVRPDKPAEPPRPDELALVTRRSADGKAKIEAWEATWRPKYLTDLAAWEQLCEARDFVSPEEMEDIERLAAAAEANPLADKIFAKGQAEVSVFWTDAETGVLCKARADWLRDGAIFDLKTCYSASPRDFQSAVAKYRYDLSAAFYLDGFATAQEVKHFSWIAIEKNPPYAMGFYAADQELLNAGRADYRKALELYAACDKSGHWPGYAESFVNLSLTGA